MAKIYIDVAVNAYIISVDPFVAPVSPGTPD